MMWVIGWYEDEDGEFEILGHTTDRALVKRIESAGIHVVLDCSAKVTAKSLKLDDYRTNHVRLVHFYWTGRVVDKGDWQYWHVGDRATQVDVFMIEEDYTLGVRLRIEGTDRASVESAVARYAEEAAADPKGFYLSCARKWGVGEVTWEVLNRPDQTPIRQALQLEGLIP